MLSKFFLDRPVFAWVIAIIMMAAGCLAIYNLPISQYPPIAPPSIAITAFYPGGSAETVENSVTQIIEQKMTGFDKMLYLSASSDSSGSSRVELTFAPGTDADLAWAQVQNKLQLAMASLPEVVQSQGVKVSKSTRNYLLIVGLISEDGSMNGHDLQDYAASNLEKVLSRVPGVGEVEIFGSQYSMRVWLNPDKLTDYKITIQDVITAMRAYNVEVSAGQFGGVPAVKGQRLNASIIVQSMLKTPEEFADIPLRTNPDGSIVRVKDVGRTELGTEFYDTEASFNGKPSAMLAIRQAAGANALKIADSIRAKMKEMSSFFFNPDYSGAGGAAGNFRHTGAFRILHQHADDVRYGAGHRPPGGRRYCSGGERGTNHERGRPFTYGGYSQVDGPNHQRVDWHRVGALGGLRPYGVFLRVHRGHLPSVLDNHHCLHASFSGGGTGFDTSAVRLASQACAQRA